MKTELEKIFKQSYGDKIMIDEIVELYAPIFQSLKESNNLVMDLQIQLVQKSVDILDLKIGLREIMRLMNPCSEVYKKCKYLLDEK